MSQAAGSRNSLCTTAPSSPAERSVGKQFQDAPPNWVTEDAERVHATNISRRFVIVVIH